MTTLLTAVYLLKKGVKIKVCLSVEICALRYTTESVMYDANQLK